MLGLYRGFVPSVIEAMVQNVVYKYSKSLVLPVVNHLLPEEEIEVNVDDLTTNRDKMKEVTKAALFLTVAGCLTEVITRPFTVITLRAIAQHVGQETMYSSVLQAARQIYNEEGIAGFYSGLVPALLSHVINSLVNPFVMMGLADTAVYLKSQVLANFNFRWVIAYHLSWQASHPLNLVSTLMAVNGSGLAAVSTQFSNWRDCWDHLRATDNLFRGFWSIGVFEPPPEESLED